MLQFMVFVVWLLLHAMHSEGRGACTHGHQVWINWKHFKPFPQHVGFMRAFAYIP